MLSSQVDFAPPVGYKEPDRLERKQEDMAVDEQEFIPETSGFVAFKGTGNRLDGKKRKESVSEDKSGQRGAHQRGIPDYNYKIGTLKFMRNSRPPNHAKENKDPTEDFKAFTGTGFSLRKSMKK